MATFVITGKDGARYKVTAPDEATARAEFAKQQQAPVSTPEDVARSAGSGLRSGTEMLLGMPGDVNQMTQSVAGRVARALFGEQGAKTAASWVPKGLRSEGITTPDIQASSEKLIGPAYQPQTRPGRYTKSIAEQAPTAVVGPGGRLAKIAQALFAGAGAEGAGELAEGSGYEPLARAAGGLAGGLAGGRVPSPAPTGRELARQANVATLDREGVPLTAGQRTGSERVQYIESELGGGAYSSAMDTQRDAFTDATMRRLGEPGGNALPEDLVRARNRIGGEFDRLAAQTAIPFDQQLQTDLLNSAVDYQEIAPQVAPAVENLMNRMAQMSAENGGVLAGPNYQEMATKLRELGESADVPTGQALTAFRNALDDAVERNLGGPELEQWRDARRQYANLMTVERSMTGAGVEAATGQISPMRLRSAISGGGQGPAAIAEGRSTLTDLANAGTGVTKGLPQSGTAPRSAARAIPAAAAGGLAGWASGDPFTALAAAAGGAAVPEIVGYGVMSPFGQSVLTGPSADQRALLASLLAARQGGMGGR